MIITILNLPRQNPNSFYFKTFLDTLFRDDDDRIIYMMHEKYIEYVEIDCEDMPINKRIKIVLSCMKSKYDFDVRF